MATPGSGLPRLKSPFTRGPRGRGRGAGLGHPGRPRRPLVLESDSSGGGKKMSRGTISTGASFSSLSRGPQHKSSGNTLRRRGEPRPRAAFQPGRAPQGVHRTHRPLSAAAGGRGEFKTQAPRGRGVGEERVLVHVGGLCPSSSGSPRSGPNLRPRLPTHRLQVSPQAPSGGPILALQGMEGRGK